MNDYRLLIAFSSVLFACSSDVNLETGGAGGAGAAGAAGGQGGQGGQGGAGSGAASSSNTSSAQGGEGGIDPVGPGTGTGGSGPGPGTGGGGPNDCASACEGIYTCGTETNANGDPLCPNFTGDPGQQAQFEGICVSVCDQQPILIALVDPNDCEGTIETLKGVQPQFEMICGDNTEPPTECSAVCSTLYACGLENNNCPGFSDDPMSELAFLDMCVPQCEGNPALAQIVDPMNCTQTVNTLEQISQDFAAACQGMP